MIDTIRPNNFHLAAKSKVGSSLTWPISVSDPSWMRERSHLELITIGKYLAQLTGAEF